ncbi:hypothetical protein Asp14428_49010 [Actinoplanes sp. NBRC 14428]|nr:hypothetical protein Asp14428_49010 [Actinoplanes sp. NBRC 14428]
MVDGVDPGMSDIGRLEHLTEVVRAAGHDSLERLAVAVHVSGELRASAHELVRQFVEQARASGASWTDIGLTLGISKQAAQKRFSPGTSRQLSD